MSSSPEGNERKQEKRKIMQAMSQHKEPRDFLQLLREESCGSRDSGGFILFFHRARYIRIILCPVLGSGVAGFFGHFLGLGKATTVVLFSLLIFLQVVIFRRCIRIFFKSSKKLSLVIADTIYIVLYFEIFILGQLIKLSVLPYFGCLGLFVLHMTNDSVVSASSENRADDSGVSASSESSFSMNVLMEPFPDENENENARLHRVERNRSLETSLGQRINLFDKDSPFLMGKEPADYFREVQNTLRSASTQKEYNFFLDLENQDLQVRELKQDCFHLFQQAINQRPELNKKCVFPTTDEAIVSFLNQPLEEFENELPDPATDIHSQGSDEFQKQILAKIAKDMRTRARPLTIFMSFVSNILRVKINR